MNNKEPWSRLKGFFSLSIEERRKLILSLPIDIDKSQLSVFDQDLALIDADRMSENVIGTFSLPFSIAPNFVIDNHPVLVPMVTEEPSIVAACTKMAKLVSQNNGFFTAIDKSIVKGQVQIYDIYDIDKAKEDFKRHKDELGFLVKNLCSRMEQRGGGFVDINMRILPSAALGPMIVIEPLIDVVDAMGANMVNTVLEALAPKLIPIFGGTLGLRIISNLSDRRLARARCNINVKSLATDAGHDDGKQVAKKLIAAHAFAEADAYRACTHNKGILNGIDAIAIATGNDFRAIEAGAHAFATRAGIYKPLTALSFDEKQNVLCAELTLPLAVGVVGGIVGIHPGVRLAHALLGRFAKTAQNLSAVMVSVGLSQCLAALLALSEEGIQKGHMRLHQKKLEKPLFR